MPGKVAENTDQLHLALVIVYTLMFPLIIPGSFDIRHRMISLHFVPDKILVD